MRSTSAPKATAPASGSAAEATGDGLGLVLERVTGLGDLQRAARRRAALLRDVRELVGEQRVAAAAARRVLARAEVDVGAGGERPCRHGAGQIGGPRGGVDPHALQ